MNSQNTKILQWLKLGHSITPIDALKLFGCFRLSARIHDLKKDHDIKTNMIKVNDKEFAEYTL